MCVCLQSCKFIFCKIYNTVNYRSHIIAEAWVFVFPRPLPPLPPGCWCVGVCLSQALASFTAAFWTVFFFGVKEASFEVKEAPNFTGRCSVIGRGCWRSTLKSLKSGGAESRSCSWRTFFEDRWPTSEYFPGTVCIYRASAASPVLRGSRLSLIGLAKGPIAVQPFFLPGSSLTPSSAHICSNCA